jgi:hypothetical protein
MVQNLLSRITGMELKIKIAVLVFFFFPISYHGSTQILFQYDSSITVTEGGKLLTNPWTGGLNAGQYGRIDINGDQLDDLVVFDRSSRTLYPFILLEDKFIYSPDLRPFFPDEIEGWILFKDYDCDGRKDIFANADRGMKVYRNVTPAGEFLKWELISDPVLTLTSSGNINLQVNITDVPAIEDIDGDGDLDILVYNFAIGGFIRHHQNMSVEKTGSCGQLDYELVSRNWGYFEECDCMLYAFEEFGESCADFVAGRVMHAGGKSILLIDMDNDGDMDFLGGHEQCEELYYLENIGSPEEAKMISFETDFPDPDKPSNFFIHPAGYIDDFDLDGIRDLVVAPNEQYNIDHRIDFGSSSWFYRNTGTNELPEFTFVTERFLQSGMIDLGGNAVPSLVDEDGDGDLDLIIGANGKEIDNAFYGYIRVYENTGDFLNPAFELKYEDYLGLSDLQLYDFIPVFADLNHDGALDMILNGTDPERNTIITRLYLNSSAPGGGLKYETAESIILDLGIKIDDTPFFTDVNKDGLNDMLLGRSTGRLEYHVNNGSAGNPGFKLEDPAFLGIDDDFIDFKRNLVPFVTDFDLDGRDDLITSDYTGVLNIYRNYQDQPQKFTELIFNPMLESSDTSGLGYHTWLTGGILLADEYPVLLAGSESGGVILYRSAVERKVSDSEAIELVVYPNPANKDDLLNIRTDRDGYLYIYNSLGQLLEVPLRIERYVVRQFDFGHIPGGVYILKFIDLKGRSTASQYIRY